MSGPAAAPAGGASTVPLAPPTPRDDWLTAGPIRFRFRVAGPAGTGADAMPLVLVHGLGVSSDYFARLQPLLAGRRPVYAVDLPGFGHTTRPRTILNGAGLARALRDWLDAAELKQIHLLGHSQGGQIVVEFTRSSPARVARLILAGTTIGRQGPGPVGRFFDLLRDVPREDLTLLPVVLPAYLRAGVPRIARTEALVNDDATDAALARLRLPTLIVRGDRDCVVDASAMHKLLAAAPHARYVEIPGAAHALHWSHAPALAGLVNDFLDREGAEASATMPGGA